MWLLAGVLVGGFSVILTGTFDVSMYTVNNDKTNRYIILRTTGMQEPIGCVMLWKLKQDRDRGSFINCAGATSTPLSAL